MKPSANRVCQVINHYNKKSSLKKTALDDTFAREFHAGGNLPFAARLPLVMLRFIFHLNGRAWQKIPTLLRKGLHNILELKSGKTLDKSHFSGNKSLHEKNDLMEKTFDAPLPMNFTLAGIPPFAARPPLW